MRKLITSLVLIPVFLTLSQNRLMSEKYEPELEKNFTSSDFDLENSLMCSESKNYESVIDYIKAHEGFAGGKEYICVSGRRTIGYGHVILKGEKFPEIITREFADSLLRADFSKSYILAQKYAPQLLGSRRLAISHFIYSKGIAAFLQSGLRKAINRGGDVDAEFSKWCHYTDRKTGRKVYSKVGARIQKWEANMWHKDDELYASDKKLKNSGKL
ncbi:MAG: hypothetical protein IKR41_09120 [Bacteroidales bacterium]|nr:hypothetical protein [Bacteroidales bacterium]